MNSLVKYLAQLAKKGPAQKELADQLNQKMRHEILAKFSGLAEDQGGGLAQRMLASADHAYPKIAKYDHPDVSTRQWNGAIEKVMTKLSGDKMNKFGKWSAMKQPSMGKLDQWRHTVTKHGADLETKLRGIEDRPGGIYSIEPKDLAKLDAQRARASKARRSTEDLMDWLKVYEKKR